MSATQPTEYPLKAPAVLVETSNGDASSSLSLEKWIPMVHQDCTFPPEIFYRVMGNFIKNPNINTSWLFRADIKADQSQGPFPSSLVASDGEASPPALSRLPQFESYTLTRLLVRNLVPRNTLRDNPMDQTCLFYTKTDSTGCVWSLIVYIPHSTSADMPFYHPNLRALAHLHQWSPESAQGSVSVHYVFWEEAHREDIKLGRTALRLLGELHKHGKGQAAGYKKRVHHDLVVPQKKSQTRYAKLKMKYASQLVNNWVETTDPTKHVFEDLGISAFLIELWHEMYIDKGVPFPGFVDIGCGNGLLVYILRQEGFHGWGFDARSRRSWEAFKEPAPSNGQEEPLQTKVLLPAIVSDMSESSKAVSDLLHNGVFPKGTFIVSNHADELTPWTPIIATYSDCPFIAIPCCSHNLAGDRFRAIPPRDKAKGHSSYACLVDWVARIGEDCGFKMETEMLRIPSTRNTCLLGRIRTQSIEEVDLGQIISKFGGCGGYFENVIKLTKDESKEGNDSHGS
ncbi:hypothetical protein TD95_001199 [Thielaviopsis punctulata]|uniref:tRNA (uracil-O(2)-)-methyltransferase n=1 Tax=Thielaviopsis punctulata TaxID=72032 RepID=A0A0F4ZBN3_9PEZI|nr:hypothetical protein TD95_001199 [Thielaviopsis punctulata]